MLVEGENLDSTRRQCVGDVDQAIATTDESIGRMEGMRWWRGNIALVAGAVDDIATA